jgi:hypothetical protein
MNSTVMAWARIGVAAMTFIIVAKLLLVPLGIPGVSKVVATA